MAKVVAITKTNAKLPEKTLKKVKIFLKYLNTKKYGVQQVLMMVKKFFVVKHILS